MAFSVPVSAYEKLTLILSVTLFGTYTVSFASPQWLSKDIPLPHSLNLNLAMGLFKYCKELTSPIPSNPLVKMMPSDCSSDGADDWQMIAAGFAIAALVLSFVIAVVSFVLVFAQKVKGNLKLKCFQAGIQFLTVGSITAVLILYVYNNRFEIPVVLLKVSLDLSWGYYLSVAAAPLGAIYMLSTIVNIIILHKPTVAKITEEPIGLRTVMSNKY